MRFVKLLLPAVAFNITACSVFGGDIGPGADQPLLQAACQLKLIDPGLSSSSFYKVNLEYEVDPTTVKHVNSLVGQADGAERYQVSVEGGPRDCAGGTVIATKMVGNQIDVRMEFAGLTNPAPSGKPMERKFTRFNFSTTFTYRIGTRVTREEGGRTFIFVM